MRPLRVLFWGVILVIALANWPLALALGCAYAFWRDVHEHRKPTTTRRRS